MGKASEAIGILRNRVTHMLNYGGEEENEIRKRINEIKDEKTEIVGSMMEPPLIGGNRKAYRVKINKLGGFVAEFYNYNFSETPEETKLSKKLEILSKERTEKCNLLRKKLDDISLKISISGLDAETTQLLKDFIKELEKIEN